MRKIEVIQLGTGYNIKVEKPALTVEAVIRANELVIEFEEAIKAQQKAQLELINSLGRYQNWLEEQVKRIRNG